MDGTEFRLGIGYRAAGLAFVLVLMLLLGSSVSRADDGYAYDPISPAGYELHYEGLANEGDPAWPLGELIETAGTQLGLEIQVLFAVQPGMRRFYEERQQGDEWRWYRYVVQPLNGPLEPVARPFNYSSSNYQLFIGKASACTKAGPLTYDEKSRIDWPTVVCIAMDEDGTFRLAGSAKHVYESGIHIGGVMAMDMTGDGKLELAIHWCGASSEGLLVYMLEPDGSLTPAFLEGSRDSPGNFWDHYHDPVILDYDGDGLWEVEVHDYYEPGFRYYWCSKLWSYDPARGIWLIDHDKLSDYYQPQAHVYQGLLDALNDTSNNLDKYRHVKAGLQAEYACQIDGHWYPLDPFIDHGRVVDFYLDEVHGLAAWVYRMTGIEIE